jgi:hypothetical protein
MSTIRMCPHDSPAIGDLFGMFDFDRDNDNRDNDNRDNDDRD